MSISQFPPASGVSLATTYKVGPGDNPIPFPKGLFQIDSSVSNTFPFTFSYSDSFEPQPSVESDSTTITVGDEADKIVMPKGFTGGITGNSSQQTYAMLVHPDTSLIVSSRRNSIGNSAPYYSDDNGETWSQGNSNSNWNASVNVVLSQGYRSEDRPHEPLSGNFAALLGSAANNYFGQYVNNSSNSFSMNTAPARPNNNSSVRDAILYPRDSSNANYNRALFVTSGGTIRMNNNGNNWENNYTTVSGITSSANAAVYDGLSIYVADGTGIYKNSDNAYGSYSLANNTPLPDAIAEKGLAGTTNEILAVTNNLEVFKSTDQAQTWNSVATIGNTQGSLHDFRYIGTTALGVYAISTNTGYIHYSIDKGETFDTDKVQNSSFLLSGYQFTDDSSKAKFLFGSQNITTYQIIEEIPHLPSFLTLTQLSELTDLTQ